MLIKKISYNFFKDFIDRILSFFLLIILSPLMFLLAFLIYIKLGKPIVFCHYRAGLYGKPFLLFKFRTMENKYNSNGQLLPDEDRLTKFGNLLRSTSLDEIPSLINVLKGDMSFIGPRPLLLDYVDLYTKEQRIRLSVKPGISGLAQVKGRNSISWNERFLFDINYVKNRSLLLDFKIVINTFWTVISRKGISPKDKPIMDAFTGEKDLDPSDFI